MSAAVGQSPIILVLALFLGALSFATALAWNDAISTFFQENINVDSNNKVKARAYYAGTVTAILFVAGYLISSYYPSVLKYN